jgi:hypothetical protein
MSEVELLEKLANAINRLTKPTIPLSIDLWDVSTIAQFLKRSDSQVRERVTCLPDFPKAIRLPSQNGRGHPLYKATEVIAWVESLQEKKTKQ